MSEPDLRLHIEELILDGFDARTTGSGPVMDRSVIASAVQSELTRLFAERGVPASLSRGGQVAHLDGGKIHLAPGFGPDAIGGQIAQALYRGFSQ
jgi:hypothetical protein